MSGNFSDGQKRYFMSSGSPTEAFQSVLDKSSDTLETLKLSGTINIVGKLLRLSRNFLDHLESCSVSVEKNRPKTYKTVSKQ